MIKLFLICLTVLSVCACASVAPEVAQRTVRKASDPPTAVICHASSPLHVDTFRHVDARGLIDPAGFRVLNWNVFKGSRPGWLDTFSAYGTQLDLIILQEAYLTAELRQLLHHWGMQWDLAETFRLGPHATGVMTLSRAAPREVCVQRIMEPLLATPKSTLISKYPLAGSHKTLLVANTHLVNFTLGTAAFRRQLAQLLGALDAHEGPLIIAGDFNTWNASRTAVLDELLGGIESLQQVAFDPGHLTKVFNRRLDYVYYRGLQAVEHTAHETSVSDHNPMWITFRLAQETVL